MPGKGVPFVKGDPRINREGAGRPKMSQVWKDAAEALREALPKFLLMPRDQIELKLSQNPTGAEILAMKYIDEHPIEAVDRFVGRIPTPDRPELGLHLHVCPSLKQAKVITEKLLQARKPPELHYEPRHNGHANLDAQ